MAPAADDLGFVPEEAGGAADLGFVPEGPEAVTISPEVAARDAALRTTPRGEPVQIGEPTTAEKVAGYIPEELTATLASYGRSVLPVIYSAAAEKLGLTREEQRRLEREHPLATGAGSVLGIATQIAAVGPLAGAGRVAGATAAETAAAAGASKIAQVGEAMSAALPAAMGAKATLLAPVAVPVAALGTAARVVAPDELVDTIVEIEEFEVAEFTAHRREQFLAEPDMLVHRAADIEEQQHLHLVVQIGRAHV